MYQEHAAAASADRERGMAPRGGEGGADDEAPADGAGVAPYGSAPEAHRACKGQMLKFTVVGARGLHTAHWAPSRGMADPYCICEIPGRPKTRLQTRIIDDSLDPVNPVWNHEAEIDYVDGDSIAFTVRDRLLGGTSLGATLLSEQFHSTGFEGELPLSEGSQGTGAILFVKIAAADPEAAALHAAKIVQPKLENKSVSAGVAGEPGARATGGLRLASRPRERGKAHAGATSAAERAVPHLPRTPRGACKQPCSSAAPPRL
eukprot:CAMPEP_0179292572 /NCGR_PEP_ID=MMETSP0797-20121207/42923_1 /TAXON_ID=47934 /ORGANISM="Dinophysis acuminata, Strain DAEP01" /LENGTH=260 /DNA_ID=CAMNT_0021001685 /DNA_START=1 /DNA_END=785 /DNA_ORIENTATION=-